MLGRKTNLRHCGGLYLSLRVLIRTPRLIDPVCLRQYFWSLVRWLPLGDLGSMPNVVASTLLPVADSTLALSTGSLVPGLLTLWGAAWSGMQAPGVCEIHHPFSHPGRIQIS